MIWIIVAFAVGFIVGVVIGVIWTNIAIIDAIGRRMGW